MPDGRGGATAGPCLAHGVVHPGSHNAFPGLLVVYVMINTHEMINT